MGTVLVAYDGSDISNKAVQHAAGLVGDEDSLVILYVVPEEDVSGLGDIVCPEDALSAEEAHLLVNSTAGDAAKRHDIMVVGQVRRGPPGPTIVDAVKDLGASVVVVGVGRVEKVSCFALGSVADYVARHSSTPVLIVR